MKDASVYKHNLLTQQAGENQTFSALRRLRWIEAVGSTSLSTVVQQICRVMRGPCRNLFLASETAGGEQGWTFVYLTLVCFPLLPKGALFEVRFQHLIHR